MTLSPRFDLLEMIRQSARVITRPTVASFERFERGGTLVQGLTYVALTSLVAGLIGVAAPNTSFLEGVLVTLLGYLAYVFTVYSVGQAQGGTGSLDEVAYTFSLFWVPLAILLAILKPLLMFLLAITVVGLLLLWVVPILGLVVNSYFAYTAVQASMNLRGVGAIVGTLLVAVLIGGATQALVQYVVP